MRLRSLVPFLSTLAALALTACSGGGSSPNPPASISVVFGSAPPSSLVTSTTANISAIVNNDSSNAGVSWSVSCSSSACGSISPASSASGAMVVYTAPATVPSPASVTITAKSVADSTKSVSSSITITGPQPISVAITTAPPSSLVVNGTANVSATVENDTKNAGVIWSVTCGTSACGSFNPTTSASGGSVTYTAPGAVPSPATVTITATSLTDNTKSASATVTITAMPPPVLADGTYLYHLSGQDNFNNYFVAGAFTVKDGAITAGEQDYSDSDGYANDPLVPASSSISQSGDTIEVVLATADTTVGVSGIVTLHGTAVSNSRVLISEFDSSAAATGSIDLQASAAPVSGSYAFTVSGVDTSGYALAVGGVLNFSGSTLSTANSVFDLNDGGGTTLLAQTFASGVVSAADSFGRVTISLTPSQASGIQPFILVAYVNGNSVQLIESGSIDSLGADLGGTALAQGTNAGQFSVATIENTNYVFTTEGQDTNGPLDMGGAFVFAPAGAVSGSLVFNDLNNNNADSFSGAAYRVDPTGRVSITGVIPSAMTNISLAFEIYLDGNGNALVLGADSIEQTGGLAYEQNGLNDYEGNFAINVRGFLNGPNYEQPYGAVGPVSISADNIGGATEYTSQDPNLRTPPALTPFDSYSSVSLTGLENAESDSRYDFTGLNSLSFSGSSSFGFYPIDGSRVLGIQVDDGGIGIFMLEARSQ